MLATKAKDGDAAWFGRAADELKHQGYPDYVVDYLRRAEGHFRIEAACAMYPNATEWRAWAEAVRVAIRFWASYAPHRSNVDVEPNEASAAAQVVAEALAGLRPLLILE